MKNLSLSLLRENNLNQQLYVVDDSLELLTASVKKFGILEPLIVNSEMVILSGIRRYRVAVNLGLEEVPVVICDLHTDELTFSRLVSFNTQRVKTNEDILKEYLALREELKLGQGARTDLDVNLQDKKNRLASIYKKKSKSSLDRLLQIYTTALSNNGGDVSDAWEWVRKTNNKGIDGVLKSLKKEFAGVKPAPLKKTTKKVTSEVLVGGSKLSVVYTDGSMLEDPYRLFKGNNALMTALQDDSVDCCFTSPPYYSLRDYKIGDNQLGQERSVKMYIKNMMKTFNEVHRVLKPTGSLFLNIDDTVIDKELCGVPEALVLEMKKNGWILNDRIIWFKTNTLYQSNTNRTQPCMEFIYHFVKTTNFHYDKSWVGGFSFSNKDFTLGKGRTMRLRNVFKFDGQVLTTSNANTSYIQKKIEDSGLKVDHTATFPRELPLIGILSATKPGDVVLDCFNGLATTGEVALELGRKYIGYDLNDNYLNISKVRLDKTIEELNEESAFLMAA